MKNVTVEELRTMLQRINARSTTGAPVEVEGLDVWHNDHPGKGPVVRVSFRGAQSRSFRCYTDAEGLRRWYDNGTTGTDDHWESTAAIQPTPEALAYAGGRAKFAAWMTRLDNAARHHGYRDSVYSDSRDWRWTHRNGLTVREALQQLARLGVLAKTTGGSSMTGGEWAMCPVALGALVFVSGFGVLVFGGHADEDRADVLWRVAPAVVVMILGVAVAFA